MDAIIAMLFAQGGVKNSTELRQHAVQSRFIHPCVPQIGMMAGDDDGRYEKTRADDRENRPRVD
jgi:hypothetical protein